MQLRFDPVDDGTWLVRVAAGRMLAIEPGTDIELGELLASEDGFASVLDELLRRGLSSAPSFALVEASETDVRAVVRGGAVVAAGGEEVDGAGVATWVERRLAPGPVRVTAPGGSWLLDPGGSATPAPHADVVESTVEPQEESIPSHEFLFAPSADGPAAAEDGAAASTDGAVASAEGDHAGDTVLVADLPSAVEPATPAGGVGRESAEPASRAGLPSREPVDPPIWLELPDGRREPLSAPVLLGRSPNLARSSGPLPRLLTIGGDDPDISRTHARVAVEGGTVLVTDLGSRNGTSVVIPGRAPQRLREHEPTAVLAGTVIDLGGGVILTVRED